jgi:hypothetical protein
MRVLLISYLFASVLPAVAQQGTGSISGVVQAPDGTVIAGAILSYGQLAPPRPKAPAAMIPPAASVVTASNGSFSIQNLKAGMYLVCVSVRNGAYLDPCHWSSSPPTFTLTAGLAVSNAVIQLVKGGQVQVSINDPSQVFANEGTTPGAHLMLGVRSVSGAFQGAVLVSSNASGRNYKVTVPLDAPTGLFVLPGDYHLSDGGGLQVTAVGAPYQVTAPSVGSTSNLAFTLTGFGNP